MKCRILYVQFYFYLWTKKARFGLYIQFVKILYLNIIVQRWYFLLIWCPSLWNVVLLLLQTDVISSYIISYCSSVEFFQKMGSLVDQQLFEFLIGYYLPDVNSHLMKLNLSVSLISIPWFLSLFIGFLPIEVDLFTSCFII
jgi:hypothetical protein